MLTNKTMKPEIIPAILTNSFEDFDKKIRAVEQYVKWVHLDVADGDFAPNQTWGDPVQIHDYEPGVFIEAHLMIEEPEVVIEDWLTGRSEERDSGIQRIYFHYEATSEHEMVIEKIRSFDTEVGLAVLPQTSLSVIGELFTKVDAVLLFSGTLGFYGGAEGWEKNEQSTLSKIAQLRQHHPKLFIAVDGGMNPDNAKKAVKAGANGIIAGGYIFNNENPAQAVEKLQEAIGAR